MSPAPIGTGAQLRALLRLAAPIAAAQAGFAAMGLVDTAVVGRLGAAPLGAVGLANGLFFAVAVVGLGAMMGLDPLFAQALGAGDRARARQLVWQGAWLALAASAVLSVPLALLPLVLVPAGIDPWTAREAAHCLWLRIPGVLPMLLFAGLRSYLQAEGRVAALVVAMLAANVANFALDVILVFGWGPVPAMGAPGSALATSICSALQFAILLLDVRSGGGPRAPRGADLAKALRIGLPVGLQMAAEVGVFALVGVLVGRLGAAPLAAHQVALSLASFTFCFAVGVGNAGSVVVAWSIGARDTPAARRGGLLAFAVGAAFMGACALAFWLMPGRIAELFGGDPAIVAASIPLLYVAAVFQISDGIQAVGAGALRAAGDTRFAFVANVAGHYAVGLPVALLLGFRLRGGVVGLWWGLCAGLTAVAVLLFARFWRLSSRPIEPLERLAETSRS